MQINRGTVAAQQYRWDVGTLAWIPWDGALTTGSVTVGKVDQGAAGTTAWLVSDRTQEIFELDFSGGTSPIYIGRAAPGTATAAGAWQIRKLAYDGSGNLASILFAGGSADYTAIWDNRASLSYS